MKQLVQAALPYGCQTVDASDHRALAEALDAVRLTQGPTVKAFENSLCELTGARHCIAVTNGTVGLYLACRALGIGPGQRGITTPITFVASANCIALCGGTPDFVDIDPDTICLSPEALERHCEAHGAPQVVVAVDFAGVPADWPRLKALAEHYGFFLIEDAAHAIGSSYTHAKTRYFCGGCRHSDLSVFSFHPVKTITTGEGGAVLTNDDSLARRIRCLANNGVERDPDRFAVWPLPEAGSNIAKPPDWYYEMHELSLNARITDLQCALGLSQLQRLEAFKQRRQALVRRYNESLSDLFADGRLIQPPWPKGSDPCFHLYSLQLGPQCRIGRDGLFDALRQQGIHCQVHYIPAYLHPYYHCQGRWRTVDFPASEAYFVRCISLPLFPGLSDADQQRVIDQLRQLL